MNALASPQLGRARQLREQHLYFLPGEDDGHARGSLGTFNAFYIGQLHAQHIAVEEQQCTERLILRGSGDVRLDRQVREEPPNLVGSHLGGMALLVKEDEAPDPVALGFFGAETEVPHPRNIPHPI